MFLIIFACIVNWFQICTSAFVALWTSCKILQLMHVLCKLAGQSMLPLFFLRRTCCFMLITLNSLNSGARAVVWKYCFTNCASKHRKIKVAPGYRCAGYTNGSGCILWWSVGFQTRESIQTAQVASSDGALVSRFGKGHSFYHIKLVYGAK